MSALPRHSALHHHAVQKAHAVEHIAKPKTQRILKTHKRSSVLANHWSKQARGKKVSSVQERSFINRAITYAVAEQARRAKAAAEIKKEQNELAAKAALLKATAALAGKTTAKVKAKPKSKAKKTARKHRAKAKSKATAKKKAVVHRVAKAATAKKPAPKKKAAKKAAVHHRAKSRGIGLDHELPNAARFSGWPSGSCYRSPWCTAASIADAICVLTEGRTILTRRQISSLYYSALLRPAWPYEPGIVTLPNALDAAVSLGYIWDWHPMLNIDREVIGTVCGIQLAHGDHAVALAGDGDCILYGMRCPCPEIDNGEQYIIRV